MSPSLPQASAKPTRMSCLVMATSARVKHLHCRLLLLPLFQLLSLTKARRLWCSSKAAAQHKVCHGTGKTGATRLSWEETYSSKQHIASCFCLVGSGGLIHSLFTGVDSAAVACSVLTLSWMMDPSTDSQRTFCIFDWYVTLLNNECIVVPSNAITISITWTKVNCLYVAWSCQGLVVGL